MVVGSVILHFLNSYYTGILIGYPFDDQIRDLFSLLLMVALMGIAVFTVGLIRYFGNLPMLVAHIAKRVLIYIILIKRFSGEIIREIQN